MSSDEQFAALHNFTTYHGEQMKVKTKLALTVWNLASHTISIRLFNSFQTFAQVIIYFTGNKWTDGQLLSGLFDAEIHKREPKFQNKQKSKII